MSRKKSSKLRPGEALQNLVASLERSLVDDDNVTIESPAYLSDIRTGDIREHDVLITQRQLHRVIRTSVECKDHKRPVGVSIVEAFHTKCQDTKVDKSVIVSNVRGFTANAMIKAKSLGIDCLTAEEANQADWKYLYTTHRHNIRLTHSHLTATVPYELLQPAKLLEIQSNHTYREVHEDGKWMKARFADIHDSGLLEHQSEPRETEYALDASISPVDNFRVLDASGSMHEPQTVTIHYRYKETFSEVPMSSHSYGEPQAEGRLKIVSTILPMEKGSFDVEVTVVEDQSGEPRISQRELPKS